MCHIWSVLQQKQLFGARSTDAKTQKNEQIKGKFVIADGCKVIVPKDKGKNRLKKFKTMFQFQIRNPEKFGDRYSFLTCCAITSEDRQSWIHRIQSSCIINNEFLDQVRVAYKTRTTYFKDKSIIEVGFWCCVVCTDCSVMIWSVV